MTSQRIGKYACLEIEFKYWLNKVPDDLPDDSNSWLITDHYFPHTRLRLRHMRSTSKGEDIYKLTQKYRTEAQNAYEATITNIYLTEAEYNLLKSSEARIIQKKRHPYKIQSHSLSIDVFEGHHRGLILAEMELENKADAAAFVLPSFVLKDVTDDPFFSGGNLAAMADEEFSRELSQRLRDIML